ncbi:MAG TPA: hypothetical protein IAC20_03245 [Candidatus Faecisoma merdavium]|nr:hypothetical protein [Candidatus Faecisoma merdavium]
MNDRQFTILCSLITFILSLFSSLLIKAYDNSKAKKKQKYNEFYREFYIIWNKIHQGRAYDFTDLKKADRESVVDFLLEHYYYASKKLQILIYELKTARLDNFGNNNSENKRICNQCYREIIGYMTDKEQKYRKKYNNINY